MPTYDVVLRHVPWTCQWGEFGRAPHDTPAGPSWTPESGRGWTPWTCQHPQVLPAGGHLRHGDCENCPFWAPAGPQRQRD
jgi:hypothetical protein